MIYGKKKKKSKILKEKEKKLKEEDEKKKKDEIGLQRYEEWRQRKIATPKISQRNIIDRPCWSPTSKLISHSR